MPEMIQKSTFGILFAMLLYRLEFSRKKVSISLAEKGSSRILYLDTLKKLSLPEDHLPLQFLTKIHLRSPSVSRSIDLVPFQKIELSFEQALEVLPLLGKTGRLYYNKVLLRTDLSPAKIYWKGEESIFSPFLQWKEKVIPLEECEMVFPGGVIWDATFLLLQTTISWNWIELFLKGKVPLTGAQKVKFLEEAPLILWKEKEEEKPLEVFPELMLSDATGCFANLRMEYRGVGFVFLHDMAPLVEGKKRLKSVEEGWEKDLLEAGFTKKIVGSSHYYCVGDRISETISFLLDLGWKVFHPSGKKVLRQKGISFAVQELGAKVALSGRVDFEGKKSSLQTAVQSRSLWVEIDGGSVGLIDRKAFPRVDGEWKEGALLLQKGSLPHLATLLQGSFVTWEGQLKTLVDGFKDNAFALSPPGPSFQGKLLPYQQKGVDFLSFLQKWGFSGLLADEMGLGKTVQVLAFFSRQRTNLPILVVAPSSLLFQWREEILRFLPTMPVHIHRGVDRLEDLSHLQGVILTSYALLRLDEEMLSRVEFSVIVLDESNAIKTASTQTAKAAFRLNGRFKIALSGTPMENRIEELRSQLQFLMPDFNPRSLEEFRMQMKPFILRRKKKDVEIELPEKIEQIVYVEMGEEQKALYDAYLSRAQRDLSPDSPRMEILERILRLRQICTDPRLVGSELCGTKLELLLNEIGCRKSLVYSQFTSMLELVANALEEKGIRYFLLDGSVSSEKREKLVRDFQREPESCLFLLSLKAGGVGLNLTEAEEVFLLDPWWNEAVERQAIDRAHRIGQKKTVIAKRYIVPHSIEEKMLCLKQSKRETAELLLDGDPFNWTEEDLFRLLV